MKILFDKIKINNFNRNQQRVKLSKSKNNKIHIKHLDSWRIVVDDILPKTLLDNNEHDRTRNLINTNCVFDHNSSYPLNENFDEPSQDPHSIEDRLSSLQLI